MDFYQKLNQAIATNQTLLCLELDPDLEDLRPDPTAIDSLAAVREWLWTAIAQSADWVCACSVTNPLLINWSKSFLLNAYVCCPARHNTHDRTPGPYGHP